jgi:hypothetical protein
LTNYVLRIEGRVERSRVKGGGRGQVGLVYLVGGTYSRPRRQMTDQSSWDAKTSASTKRTEPSSRSLIAYIRPRILVMVSLIQRYSNMYICPVLSKAPELEVVIIYYPGNVQWTLQRFIIVPQAFPGVVARDAWPTCLSIAIYYIDLEEAETRGIGTSSNTSVIYIAIINRTSSIQRNPE